MMLVFLILDYLIYALTMVGAYLVHHQTLQFFQSRGYPFLLLTVLVIHTVVLTIVRRDALRQSITVSSIVKGVVICGVTVSLLVFSTLFATKYTQISRFVLMVMFSLSVVLMIATRLFGLILIRRARERAQAISRSYIVYFNPEDEPIAREMARGMSITQSAPVQLTHLLEAQPFISRLDGDSASHVYVLNPYTNMAIYDQIVPACCAVGIRLSIVPTFLEAIGYHLGLQYVSKWPVIDMHRNPMENVINRMNKRFLDILISAPVVLLILPVLCAAIALGNLAWSRGPLFFRQQRVSKHGRAFDVLKFRTMHVEVSDSREARSGHSPPTADRDARVSAFGALLRRTSLDEMPQFYNVLRGDMSVVGPRPHALGEDRFLEKHLVDYGVRRFVKAGITGLAQVRGYRGGTEDMGLMQTRTNLDIWYLNNWSMMLDVEIITKTIYRVIFPQGKIY